MLGAVILSVKSGTNRTGATTTNCAVKSCS
eukprot:SAG31_NODE_43310_length_267_cov_1.232143_1_plen_29_part_01